MKKIKPFKFHRLSDRALIKVLCTFTALAVISVGIYKLTEHYPGFVTKYYSNGLYNVITYPGKLLASLFPFSLGELCLLILVLFLLYALIKGIVKTISNFKKKKPRPFFPMVRFTMWLLTAAMCALTLFIWNGGLNYNAYTIAEKENMESREYTPQELYELTVYFINNANTIRNHLQENRDGSVVENRSFSELCEIAQKGFRSIEGSYGMAKGYFTKAKPAVLSLWMCYTNITGIFPYIVPEPIINTMTPDSSLHATICHEMAHQRAIAREDEANFIAFIACMNTEDAYFMYSGYYLAAVHCLNALYGVNYQLWTEAWQHMSEGMRTDISAASEFWKQFETPVAEISDSVNDIYLQANNIEDGVASYGRLVDLLLAFYD